MMDSKELADIDQLMSELRIRSAAHELEDQEAGRDHQELFKNDKNIMYHQRRFKFLQIKHHRQSLIEAAQQMKGMFKPEPPKKPRKKRYCMPVMKKFESYCYVTKFRIFVILNKIDEIRKKQRKSHEPDYRTLCLMASMSSQMLFLMNGLLKYPDDISTPGFPQTAYEVCVDCIQILDIALYGPTIEKRENGTTSPTRLTDFQAENSDIGSGGESDAVVIDSSDFESSFVHSLDALSLKQKMQEVSHYFVAKYATKCEKNQEPKSMASTVEAAGRAELIQDSLTPIIRKNLSSQRVIDNTMMEDTKVERHQEASSPSNCSINTDTSNDLSELPVQTIFPRISECVEQMEATLNRIETDFSAHASSVERLSREDPKCQSASKLHLFIVNARQSLKNMKKLQIIHPCIEYPVQIQPGTYSEEQMRSAQNAFANIMTCERLTAEHIKNLPTL